MFVRTSIISALWSFLLLFHITVSHEIARPQGMDQVYSILLAVVLVEGSLEV